jgi:rod shape-determining protein MreC
MRRKRNRNVRVLVVTLAAVLLLSLLAQPGRSLLSTGVHFATDWLFQLTASATANVDGATREELAERVAALEQENAALRRQLADYIDVQAENEQLWKYYRLKKENPSFEMVPANVIRRDANDDFYAFTLDVGTAVGVAVNAPVITDSGLVGWVCQADAVSCKVKTILSPDTKAGVQGKQSGDSGILSGSATLCDQNLTGMTALAEDNKLQKGDMIVTAGIGGVYPSGLLVGEVQSIAFNKYDASRSAVIKPYVDVRTVTSAAVITAFEARSKVVSADE